MTLQRLAWVCAISATAIVGCGRGEAPPQQQPISVVVETVRAQTIPYEYRSVAQTEGFKEAEVRARVSGIMEDYYFKEGGAVSKGQRLFLIDPRPYQIALQQAEAQLASARAVLDQAIKSLERIEPLYKEHAVSKREYDDAVAGADTGKAGVKVAEANVNAARLNLIYTRVEAPISGIASKALPSRGSMINAQETLLTKVSQIDPIYVNFSYSDQAYMKLMKDIAAGLVSSPEGGRLPVSIKLSDGSVYPIKGEINFEDISIDAKTSTIQTRALFSNPDQALRPGQFVEASVEGMTRPHAITAPQRAVLEGAQGKYVYVVKAVEVEDPATKQKTKQMQAVIRPIEEGPWYQDRWVITKGLKAGEQIIVDGLVKVRPKYPLHVQDVKQKAAADKAAAEKKAAADKAGAEKSTTPAASTGSSAPAKPAASEQGGSTTSGSRDASS